MKLISMTDFVLEQYAIITVIDEINDAKKLLNKIFNYANFLNQPLKLEMFVPCDEDGNVLEEPKNYKQWERKALNTPYDLDLIKYEQYQQAKEKVLFEGFEYGYKWYETFIVMRNKVTGKGQFQLSKYKTIEGLLIDEFDFKLTPNAIKQLGL